MNRFKKIIKTIILIFILGFTINVNATNNEIFIKGTYDQTKSRQVLELINNLRQDIENNWYYDSSNNKIYPGKLEPLTYDYGLEAIAKQRASEIAVYFAHTRPNGKKYNSLSVNGYSSAEENIAAGYSAPYNVFTAWEEKDELYSGQAHRRSMLSSKNTSVGIACIYVPKSRFHTFCVQEFGRHSNISTTPSEIDNTEKTLSIGINTDLFVTEEELTFNNSPTEVYENETKELPLANVRIYSNLSGMTSYVDATSKLEWEVEDGSDKVTVNGNDVTGTKPGTATLKGKFGSSSTTHTINIKELVHITSIELNNTKLELTTDDHKSLVATINPSNTTDDKTITWTSSNDSIATVTDGIVTGVSVGTATITATTTNGKTAICEVTVNKGTVGVSYRTHVQTYGWQDYVKNGEMSGTQGEAKRLEAININLMNAPYSGDIEYRTHIQTYGWEETFKKNGEMSGTSGEAKRLEAIEIRLTGEMANHYDIYYRVHAQTYGWLGWARNGEKSGTAGYAKRLEGIEIVLVEKDESFPEYGQASAYEEYTNEEVKQPPKVLYKTHVQTYGWQDYVSNGEMSGTSGEAKRLEGIRIKLEDQNYEGDIEYRTHIQTYGWEETFKKNDEMSGTEGEAKRLEAIEIKLTGKLAEYYDVYYRVHAQTYGWLNWAKNGESAGTAGLAKRLEGIEIIVVKKGELPPARDNQNNYESFIEN